jgi:glycosyltransferase involved in cell wall biosynthesis
MDRAVAKVSVIIPTYNRADYLKAAIASVLNQTFRDFELVVVDDASADNTAEIVRGFHDTRIKFIRHEARKGGSAARNTGIANSKYEYIAFLDDDDEWFPDKLRKQMQLLLARPQKVGCVYTGYVTVDRTSGEKTGQKIPRKRGDLSKELPGSNCIGGTSAVLLRRECFDKVGLFDESLPSFQDYDLWIRISREFHFDYLKEPLFNYYLHQNKISGSPEAINRGIEIMLEKYGTSASFRKQLSYRYLSLGVDYCDSGDAGKARETFIKAIELYPLAMKHYLNLALCMLGSENFRRIKATVREYLPERRAGISHRGDAEGAE